MTLDSCTSLKEVTYTVPLCKVIEGSGGELNTQK